MHVPVACWVRAVHGSRSLRKCLALQRVSGGFLVGAGASKRRRRCRAEDLRKRAGQLQVTVIRMQGLILCHAGAGSAGRALGRSDGVCPLS